MIQQEKKKNCNGTTTISNHLLHNTAYLNLRRENGFIHFLKQILESQN